MEGSGKYRNFFEETEYGTADGIYGYNCRHQHYPYFEGISERAEKHIEPPRFEYNGKSYDEWEATQKQREFERKIRKLKRQLEVEKAINIDSQATKLAIKQEVAKYKDFSQTAGIRAKIERTRIII